MKSSLLNVGIGLTLTGIIALAAAFFITTNKTFSAAPSGLSASLATTTTFTVGPQQNLRLFTANTNCAARVIRTQGVPIVLTFFDPTTSVGSDVVSSSTLKAIVGFIQAASTTVAYDSGLYGCGEVWGFAEASTSLTKMETQ